MDSSQLQTLLANGQASATDPLGSLLEPLMPILTLFLVVSVILSIAFVIYAVVGIVQKQRQHAAIMRIDKNLQKLVDMKEFGSPKKPDTKDDHPVLLASVPSEE